MTIDEKFMNRCLSLARLGLGGTAPNPLVGAIIVSEGKIVGEGFHMKFGGSHAEVLAIRSVKEPGVLSRSTLYVNLEPCSHYGKTPPCSDLIIEKRIPRVVIGTEDTFPQVAGRGIAKLKNEGMEVVTGILEKECRELNIRFFTFHEKKRPFIILKWAQTRDGFVDRLRDSHEWGKPVWITGEKARKLSHRFRSEEAAIMVGTKTVLTDNPSLTTRYWPGKNPVRIVIDRLLKLPVNLKVFEPPAVTLVFNSLTNKSEGNLQYIIIDFEKETIPQILRVLFQFELQSLIVEGGPSLLDSFIKLNLWDEARVFYSKINFGSGIKAPEFSCTPFREEWIEVDLLKVYRNY